MTNASHKTPISLIKYHPIQNRISPKRLPKCSIKHRGSFLFINWNKIPNIYSIKALTKANLRSILISIRKSKDLSKPCKRWWHTFGLDKPFQYQAQNCTHAYSTHLSLNFQVFLQFSKFYNRTESEKRSS